MADRHKHHLLIFWFFNGGVSMMLFLLPVVNLFYYLYCFEMGRLTIFITSQQSYVLGGGDKCQDTKMLSQRAPYAF